MPVDRRLVETVRAGLRAEADADRAPDMQRYMRSSMPFLGVPVPRVRALVRAAARTRPPAGVADLRDTALELWRTADHREDRYAATALIGLPSARRLRSPELLPAYAEMITTGAWWDHVDELAHRVGELLQAFPEQVRPVVLAWGHGDDPWLRRAAILCQLGAKDATDRALLSEVVDASAGEGDFFLRKAIGWALRDYARTDAAWVRSFVACRADVLSGLSQREALKHVGRQ